MHSQYSINQQVPSMPYNRIGNPTPIVEFSEGQRPNGQFMPHPALPLLRGKGIDMPTQVVVSTGKVVALSSDGFLVPAGLLLNTTQAYTQLDVDQGLLGPDGKPVAVGDIVANKFTAAGITVSAPVGVASYDYLRHPGGDGENPVNLHYSNFNMQNKVAFTCDYVLELPVVESRAVYSKAPMKGIAAFIAAKGPNPLSAVLKDFTTIKPGDLVTFDEDSNFKVDNAPAFGTTIGQVTQVIRPTDFNMLGIVRSSSNGGGVLNQMPGTATKGLPEKITYSGGYALVRVNLINR